MEGRNKAPRVVKTKITPQVNSYSVPGAGIGAGLLVGLVLVVVFALLLGTTVAAAFLGAGGICSVTDDFCNLDRVAGPPVLPVVLCETGT